MRVWPLRAVLLVPVVVACTKASTIPASAPHANGTTALAAASEVAAPSPTVAITVRLAEPTPPATTCGSAALIAKSVGASTYLLSCAGLPMIPVPTITSGVGRVITITGNAFGSHIRLTVAQSGKVVKLSGRYLVVLHQGNALVTVRGMACPVAHGLQPITCALLRVDVPGHYP
jgi:hypothetical protein